MKKILSHNLVRICIYTLLVGMCVVGGLKQAQAAIVLFESESSVGTGSPFPVEVLLTAPLPLNAITVSFTLSPGLEISDFSDGNSLIKMWIERLHKTADNEWTASGIIPGGYSGKEGKVLTLYVTGTTPGRGSITVSSASQAYGNGGQAVPEKIDSIPASFTLVSGKVNPAPDYSSDTESPESFLPVIGKIPAEQGEVWAVTFGTQDKGSGVDYFEVVESSSKVDDAAYTNLVWQRAESPYILRDQKLGSWVYVRAVDKKGLSTIQSLAPSYTWLKGSSQYIIIGLALVACLYVLFKIISRRR